MKRAVVGNTLLKKCKRGRLRECYGLEVAERTLVVVVCLCVCVCVCVCKWVCPRVHENTGSKY